MARLMSVRALIYPSYVGFCLCMAYILIRNRAFRSTGKFRGTRKSYAGLVKESHSVMSAAAALFFVFLCLAEVKHVEKLEFVFFKKVEVFFDRIFNGLVNEDVF